MHKRARLFCTAAHSAWGGDAALRPFCWRQVSQLYVKADKTDALEDIVEELQIRVLSRQEEGLHPPLLCPKQRHNALGLMGRRTGCMFFNVLQDEDDPTIVCFTEGVR